MSEKKEGKSLFLYTALIFLAAIIIVVISFFSQINLEKKHNEYVGEEAAKSITEKTAQLSEENLILLETTKNLNEHNSQLNEKNKEFATQNETLQKNIKSDDELYKLFNLIKNKKTEEASQLFDTINAEAFSGEKLAFYEYLKKELDK